MSKDDLMMKLSAKDRRDLELAISTLKDLGAQEIYLFGSMARGDGDEHSDWDFGVKGLPKEQFFCALGNLLDALHRVADLVDLQAEPRFESLMEKVGELVRVA